MNQRVLDRIAAGNQASDMWENVDEVALEDGLPTELSNEIEANALSVDFDQPEDGSGIEGIRTRVARIVPSLSTQLTRDLNDMLLPAEDFYS